VLEIAGWAQATAAIGLAYVAGFLALVLPSGVGVREYILLKLLAAQGDEALIALGVLLLRLVWTAAELVTAGVLWCLPGPRVALAPPEVMRSPPDRSIANLPESLYNGPRTPDHGPAA